MNFSPRLARVARAARDRADRVRVGWLVGALVLGSVCAQLTVLPQHGCGVPLLELFRHHVGVDPDVAHSYYACHSIATYGLVLLLVLLPLTVICLVLGFDLATSEPRSRRRAGT
jgi:hypothetical protein